MAQNWTLTSRGFKRFLEKNHPWVFSNEIANDLKKTTPGELVLLHSPKGDAVAFGYGNPKTLIAFRKLGQGFAIKIPESVEEFLLAKLLEAARHRGRIHRTSLSHRLVHAEGDGLPGLIVDCFQTENQVLVVQVLTAGMDRILSDHPKLLERFVDQAFQEKLLPHPLSSTTILFKNTSAMRALEGLEKEETRTVYGTPVAQKPLPIRLPSIDPAKNQELVCDLVGGQKTGFFLDQVENVLALGRLLPERGGAFRILDLFSYVGQWSAQVSAELKRRGIESRVTCVDDSSTALEMANLNVEACGGKFDGIKLNIVKGGDKLPKGAFDLVICDPPALIPAKKDVTAGCKAYREVYTRALSAVKPGGIIVLSSCSYHLTLERFSEILIEAQSKARVQVKWVEARSQSSDHPMLVNFPEGQYLKTWIGILS